MTYRKRTLRGMPPTTRKLARLLSDLESVARRGKHLLAEIQTQERMAHALETASQRGVVTAAHLRAEAEAIDPEPQP